MKNFISGLYQKNKKIILTIFVFCIVFLPLVVPFSKIGFWLDDFSVMSYCLAGKWTKIIDFFYKDIRVALVPSNKVVGQFEFIDTFYRPLTYFFYFLQSILFGTWAYGYFLITVFLHSLNTAIFFNICLYFSSYMNAFLAALFFAFHPSLASWMGWLSAQQQQITLLLIFLVFILFKKFLNSGSLYCYFLSLLFFTIAIFTREVVLVVPFLLLGLIFLNGKLKFFLKFNKTISSFLTIVPFFIMIFIYIFLRAKLFPFTSDSKNSLQIFLTSFFKNRLYPVINNVRDMFGFTWVPDGYLWIKLLIFFLIVSFLILLFIFNTKKPFILFFGLGTLLFLWPLILVGYSERYCYEALPFFILAILSCIEFSAIKIPKIVKIGSLFLIFFLIVINLIFVFFNLKCRADGSSLVARALVELEDSIKTNNKPLCFFGLPAVCYFSAHGIWMLERNHNRPIYYEIEQGIFTKGDLPILHKILDVKVKRTIDAHEKFEENFLQVDFVDNVFNFRSLDVNKLCFSGKNKKGGSIQSSLGNFITNEVDEYGRVYDLTFVMDQQLFAKKTIVVTWNYKEQKFLILNQ
jgi:hypothetical protein